MQKIEKIIHTTKWAKLVTLKEKEGEYWVPIKYIEGEKVLDGNFELSQNQKPMVLIQAKKENHSEKSIKIILTMVIDEYEKTKFIFLPKSMVEEQKNNIKMEKWLWEKNIKNLIENEIEYQKKFGDVDEEMITLTGYKLIE